MSNNDVRREIEKPSAIMDSMTAARETSKTAAPPPGERSVHIPGENGRPGEMSARHEPVSGAQPSGASKGDAASGRADSGSSTRMAQSIFILAAALALLVVGRSFLVPLAVAILLWNLLNALAGAIGRIRIGRRSFPKWLAWVFALVALLMADVLIYWILISQSEGLSAAAPVYQANFEKLTGTITAFLGIEGMPSTAQLMESVDLGTVLSWLGESVGSTLSELVLVALYVAFLLVEQRYFEGKIMRMSSNEATAARTRALMRIISKQIQTYIWIKTVLSLLTGVVSYAVLRLIGVDFAAVWALIIFLLNYIPNFGSFLGVIFPAILALVQFEPLTPFILVVLALGATQFVIGNVVEPSLMGKTLNLSSLVIILSLTFWGIIWGIAGMVLCVPIMVCIGIICSHFDRLHWIAVLLSTDGTTIDAAQPP